MRYNVNGYRMEVKRMALKQPERCCICGVKKPSWNNPEPLRDGRLDCCNECNRLVVAARTKCARMPAEEGKAYLLRLRGMTHPELKDELG